MSAPVIRDRHAEILEKAGTLFLAQGYAATSMSRLAAACGGSKTTLYAYFPSKEALFRAFMQQRVQRESGAIFTFPDHEKSPERTLRLCGLRFLEMVCADDSLALLRLLYHETPRFPELGRAFYELCLCPGRRELAAYLSRLAREGQLRIAHAELAAEQFLSLCRATLLMELLLGVRESYSHADALPVVEAAVSAFLAAHSLKRRYSGQA